MNGLVIDSIFVMLVCFALGAAIAWLLAVVLYPTRKDLDALRGARAGDRRRR